MKKVLLSTLLMLLPLLAYAENVEVDGIRYNLIPEENEAEVAYNNSCYYGNIIIPDKVIHEGVEYSVKRIGSEAFYGCTGLLSVFIPNSVISIEDNAFKNCSSLTTIDIPNSVTSIGREAFNGTAWYNNQPDGLVYAGKFAYNYKGKMPDNTNISIEDGTLGIAEYAFSGCSGLTSVTIPSSVTSISNYAFYGCSGLTSITIPNSVSSIGHDAFSNCSGLTSITIPNSVTSIGSTAFWYCTKLTSITIPNSMTSIEHGTFWGCSSLTSITIPKSVTSIGYGAFHDCSSLTSVTIPTSVTTIGERAFMDCCELTTIDIPNSVTYIGFCAFEGTAWLNNQQDGLVYAGKVVYRYKGEMPDNTNISIEDGTLGIAEYAFSGALEYVSSGGSHLSSITIPNSVTSIGIGAFSHCSSLTSIDIPNNITSIGNYFFFGCSGLSNIDIPNSVTSIGQGAFEDCSGLTSVIIPKSVTSIVPSAFSGCIALNSIKVEKDNPQYDSRDNCNAIIETSSNTMIVGCKDTTFPSSVTSIGSGAFQRHSEITTISIPNNVTSIGPGAFQYCSGLTSIDIPNSVTSIGGSAFEYCSGLKSIDIPNNLSSIGIYLFQCSGLTSITIPNSVTSIGSVAFSSCIDLSSVTIPSSVTSIDGWAFAGCLGLKDFYCWANNVPSTNNYAFERTPCNSATLHVPAGSVDTYKNTYPWSLFGTIVALTDDDPKPTDIFSLKTNNTIYPVYIYSFDGKRKSHTQHGLNIIRMSDGSTKKVFKQ